MKKIFNIYLGITLLVCTNFSSCQKIDDIINGNGNKNSKNKIEFYLDGKLLPWVNKTNDTSDATGAVFYKYQYDNGVNVVFFALIFFDANNSDHNFYIHIINKDINDLKIGDNIFAYNKTTKNTTECLYWTAYNTSYGAWGINGNVTIKNIDTQKQIISFEIKDLIVTGGASVLSTDQHTINANIEMHYTFENGDN